jgi:stromal membrane-associated protein
MHQQQLAMLAQQQSLMMAAAAKSTGVDLKYTTGIQQPSPNVSVQNWPATGFPISGVMPMGAQGDMQKLMQVNDSSKPEIYIDE